jgi:hypothetical protein
MNLTVISISQLSLHVHRVTETTEGVFVDTLFPSISMLDHARVRLNEPRRARHGEGFGMRTGSVTAAAWCNAFARS